MKKIFLVGFSILMTGLVIAQPPAGDAKAGETYGEKITADGSISVNDLTKKLEKENKLNVKVEGEVVEVCAAAGCWLKMKTETGTIMIKMKDHEFFVPIAMSGKKVIVKGIAQKKVTSVEMLKHYAEDAGKSKEEIDAIKEPKKEIVITASGIIVSN